MSTGFPATEEIAGRSCPYCHFKLEEGGEVIECPVCKAVHHGECWEENSGCAIALCAGGPSLAGTRQGQPPPPPPSTEPITVSLPPVTPPPARGEPVATGRKAGARASAAPAALSGRASLAGWVPLVAALVLLLGGVTAAAIVLTGNGNERSDAAGAGGLQPGESATGFEESGDSFEEEGESEAEPLPSPAQRAEARVQHALTAHFDRLVRGQYFAAYDDLTPREGEAIGGEAGWVEAQAEDDLQSFSLEVETTLLDAHSAKAAIVEFETHAVATGCNVWSGHWEMSKVYGEWLIAAAKLENESC